MEESLNWLESVGDGVGLGGAGLARMLGSGSGPGIPSLFQFERLNLSVRAEEDLSGRQPSKVVSLQRDPW